MTQRRLLHCGIRVFLFVPSRSFRYVWDEEESRTLSGLYSVRLQFWWRSIGVSSRRSVLSEARTRAVCRRHCSSLLRWRQSGCHCGGHCRHGSGAVQLVLGVFSGSQVEYVAGFCLRVDTACISLELHAVPLSRDLLCFRVHRYAWFSVDACAASVYGGDH